MNRSNSIWAKILWGLGMAFTILTGCLAVSFWVPYDRLKPFFDLFSRRGHLDSFTPAHYTQLAGVLPVVGLVLLLGFVLAFIFRRKSLAWAERLEAFVSFQVKSSWVDMKSAGRSFRDHLPSTGQLLAVLAITLAAVFIRLVFVNKPFGHDEAYTFVAFALRPLSKVVTDYSLPNNHVLHTILVHFSYLLFGTSPLAVRLPALLSGVLMVPAAFLARQMFNANIALVSASLVAAAPVLVSYSTDARGYTLMSLLTLLIFSLAVYVKEHKNRFAWLLLALLSALGFYTLPVMLYPYGIILLWLFLSALLGDRGKDYPSFWTMVKYLVANGILTIALTLILYAPIFIYSGIGAVTSNAFVSPLSWVDFRQTLPVRLSETWGSWMLDTPTNTAYLLPLGFFLALIFHRRLSKDRFPIQIAAFLWLAAALLIQRPNPFARVWTFLFAPLMIWTSAGLIAPFMRWKLKLAPKMMVETLVSVLLALVILAGGVFYGVQNIREQNAVKDIEGSAIYLKELIKPVDRIAMDYPLDVEFWYYAVRYGIPLDQVNYKETSDYNQVYVIVNKSYDQTVQSVLAARSQNGIFCNEATILKIKTIDYTDIYSCNPQ